MTTTDQQQTKPLTADELARIRRLADAATEGPWGTYDDGTGLIDIAADLKDTGTGYQCRRYIGQLEADQIDNDPTHKDWDEDRDRDQVQADADFIADARESVPALLAEVKRLRIFAEATNRRHEEIHALLATVEISKSAEAWDLGMAILALLDGPPPRKAETGPNA